jgi:hypothetical protein
MPWRTARGERSGAHVLTTAQVIEIRRRARMGEEWTDLAHEFGVSRSCIRGAVSRVTWAHVE